MSHRLELIAEQVGGKTPKFFPSSFDFLGLQDLLSKEENVKMTSFRMLD